MACLQGDLLPTITLEVPLGFTQPEEATKPVVDTMYASCIMQDEASRVTYVEIVITSIGWVALRQAQLAIQNPQLTIEDITDLLVQGDNNCL